MVASTPPENETDNLESRLVAIENALKFDERINNIQVLLEQRKSTISKPLPWWKNAKTITVLGALIAAVLPLMTAIDGLLKNARDSQRLLLEQQDKIRQTYLDRVLKPGMTEGEQARIFGLLIKLKNDKELQEWALDEYSRVNLKLGELYEKRQKIDEENSKLEEQRKMLMENPSTKTGEKNNLDQEVAHIQEIITKNEKELDNLRNRMGDNSDSITTRLNPEKLSH
jgi:hypothetical protein